MNQLVPGQPRNGVPKFLKLAGLILGGTVVAALLMGWVAFLLWLGAEAVMAVVQWL